jgi:hypothetical protein
MEDLFALGPAHAGVIRLSWRFELGHTDQELLHRHYRELVKPEQAEKYWNIRPAVQTNVVAISA